MVSTIQHFRGTRNQKLNLLDSAILSTLVYVMLLVCSLDGRSYGVTVIFWILPLIFLFNYLTYSTKLKHIIICSEQHLCSNHLSKHTGVCSTNKTVLLYELRFYTMFAHIFLHSHDVSYSTD